MQRTQRPLSAEWPEYSIKPTIAEVDADLATLADSTLERYRKDSDPALIQSAPWERLDIDQRRAARAENELAKRQRLAALATTKAAEEAERQERDTALIDAEIAAYKQQMRGAFKGTEQQFNAVWPRILEDWQIEQARASVDANRARLAAHYAL